MSQALQSLPTFHRINAEPCGQQAVRAGHLRSHLLLALWISLPQAHHPLLRAWHWLFPPPGTHPFPLPPPHLITAWLISLLHSSLCSPCPLLRGLSLTASYSSPPRSVSYSAGLFWTTLQVTQCHPVCCVHIPSLSGPHTAASLGKGFVCSVRCRPPAYKAVPGT